MSILLAYCREGFEKTLSDDWKLSQTQVKTHCYPAYVIVEQLKDSDAQAWIKEFSVFARQILYPAKLCEFGDEKDRISPILDRLSELLYSNTYSGFWIEYPDTNEGRALAKFAKKFTGALNNALKKDRRFKKVEQPYANKENPWIHIFFPSYSQAVVALRTHNQVSEHNGILRLKPAKEAPSRAGLKLEEAFHSLISETSRQELLSRAKEQAWAVDLGAAPGGWSYYLRQLGFQVLALDNANMAPILADDPKLLHLREDALHFQTEASCELLVCDMVERPSRVVELVERWVKAQLCQHAVFNLKLPMKKRAEQIREIRERLEKLAISDLKIRQLYHDREEVTVYLKLKAKLKTNKKPVKLVEQKNPSQKKALSKSSKSARDGSKTKPRRTVKTKRGR